VRKKAVSDGRPAAGRSGAAAFTYPEVGATAGEPLPAGYHHVRQAFAIGRGPAAFAAASTELMEWRMHRRAGVRVTSPSPDPAAEGDVVLLTLGVGRLGIRAPCRVVYTVDADRRRGFAYGTLPGHPAVGEEAFVVEHGSDDVVRLLVTAFSRPGTWYARLGGPVTRLGQRIVTRRYGRAAAQH
jgi:uncharacterized protein (UPF0548 family)